LEIIDLRSDTITKPTPEMRAVIANAEVGDAVFDDDPTVHALEKKIAEILGKEAALYMPSGTMTNQVALRAHTEPGDEIILDADAHIYYYEAGAPFAIAGLSPRFLRGERGVFTAQQVLDSLRPANKWFTPTKLISLENTHNRGGGKIWPIEQIAAVEKIARERNMKMHLDGARLWNAAAATQTSEKQIAKYFDTVSVCFSKGLGAPVGSALVGSNEFIERAMRFRTQFGGGMRQAGMIAAGAIFALDNNRSRLADDHSNAKRFASELAAHSNLAINPDEVETNIVLLGTKEPAGMVLEKLSQAGLLLTMMGEHQIRAVTNLHINQESIDRAVRIIQKTI